MKEKRSSESQAVQTTQIDALDNIDNLLGDRREDGEGTLKQANFAKKGNKILSSIERGKTLVPQ